MPILRSARRPSYQQGFARSAAESAYPQLWRGLVGAWVPSLGPTGGTLYDWSGYRNHGTLTNMDAATDWTPGERGWKLDLDGSNDMISIGDVSTLEITSDMTVAAEVTLAASGSYPAVMSKHNAYFEPTAKWCLYFFNNARQVSFARGGDRHRGSANAVSLNQPTLVAATTSTTETVLYAGGKIETVGGTAVPTYSTETVQIGDWNSASTSGSLSGSIGPTYVWARKLGITELDLLNADPLAPFRLRRRTQVRVVSAPPASTGFPFHLYYQGADSF